MIQIILFIPIAPFSKCFSAMYRVCCPCFYKKQKKLEGTQGKQDKPDTKQKKIQPTDKNDKDIESQPESDDDRPPKYSTIMQLTNATVVAEPPPAFARFMLRKSVHQLSSEVRYFDKDYFLLFFYSLVSSYYRISITI